MVRQFTLINANGDVWNLMSKSSFFHAPGGLGFTKSIETEIAGFEFIELRDDLDQKVVSGEMVFADYAIYRDFAKFISHEPLRLGYKPYSTTWYYLDVKVSSLQKTEIDRSTGLLLCPIDFLAFTTWYTIDKYENVIPVPPPVVNLMVRGNGGIIVEDSSDPPNGWKILASTDSDDVTSRVLSGNEAPVFGGKTYNTVPVQLPGFTGDVYDLTPGDYYFKVIGKRQNVKSYFQTLPNVETASGNPIEIDDAVEVAPNELSVEVSPKQDGTPWISSSIDTDPYTFRSMPSGASGGNREYDKLVGGSVVWNQLIPSYATGVVTDFANKGLTATLSENNTKLTVTGTATSSGNINTFFSGVSIIKDHVYILDHRMTGTGFPGLRFSSYGFSGLGSVQIKKASTSGSPTGLMVITSGDSYNFVIQTQFHDLTVLLGDQTKAETVLAMGDTDGVAWFYKYFGNKYHAYTSAPKIESVSVSEKVTTGKNLFDKSATTTEAYLDSDGNIVDNVPGNNFSLSNYIRIVGSQITYSGVSNTSSSVYSAWYDGNKNLISTFNLANGANTLTVPSDAVYARFSIRFQSPTDVRNTFQVELGSTATAYESYTANTYALSHTELRGILSIVDGKLVYDGDEYSSSGSVVRKYTKKTIADLTITMSFTGIFTVTNSGRAYGNGKFNILAEGYVTYTGGHSTASNIQSLVQANGNGIYCNAGSNTFFIADSAYTSASDFTTAKGTSVLVYELETATTESTDPFTNPQVIDPNGTESYTDYPVSQGTRDVAIPVGHKSNYALSVPVVGMDEVSVNVSGKNRLDDVYADWSLGANYRYLLNVVPQGKVANMSFVLKDPTVDISAISFGFCYENPSSTPPSQFRWVISAGSIQNNKSNISQIDHTTVCSHVFIYPRLQASWEALFAKYDIQVELGSTATDYEPFTGNTTYTHSMSTMYGGQVEMVSGVETSTMAEYTIQATDTFALSLSDSGRDFWRLTTTLSPTAKGYGNMWCDYFNNIDPLSDNPRVGDAYLNANKNAIFVTTANAFDATSIKDLLVGLGCKIHYEVLTPSTNQGAVGAVALLKGENVLSTDGDDIELTYKAYPDERLVLDKFGELESDPDSAVDSQAVTNFTVYEPSRVQFYMDYEGLPYDYDVKAELVSGSYSNEKIYSYPYPYTYGAGVNGEIHVTNDGTVPAYCKLTIVGEVEDPVWSVYQNGQLLERGRVTATIVSGHKLVMNSQPRSLELAEYDIDGTFVANLYGVSDFSTKRFITIPVGESTITVTHTGESPFDMYLEVYPLVKTI